MRTTEGHESVKSLLAGSAILSSTELPLTWTRPLSNAVISPAHAQGKSPDQDWNNNDSTGSLAAGDSKGYNMGG